MDNKSYSIIKDNNPEIRTYFVCYDAYLLDIFGLSNYCRTDCGYTTLSRGTGKGVFWKLNINRMASFTSISNFLYMYVYIV